MVSVYKTDIPGAGEAARLLSTLQQHFPGRRINIDLHDCDRVLRIEGDGIRNGEVEMLVKDCGFSCSELE